MFYINGQDAFTELHFVYVPSAAEFAIEAKKRSGNFSIKIFCKAKLCIVNFLNKTVFI